jgi:hypothetical protein
MRRWMIAPLVFASITALVLLASYPGTRMQ